MSYAATIFLSSFLLFLVQPLIARQILPWFGGTAAVWTTCMLFFQSVLLAGYAYAHATNAKLQPRPQAVEAVGGVGGLHQRRRLVFAFIPSRRWVILVCDIATAGGH